MRHDISSHGECQRGIIMSTSPGSIPPSNTKNEFDPSHGELQPAIIMSTTSGSIHPSNKLLQKSDVDNVNNLWEYSSLQYTRLER